MDDQTWIQEKLVSSMTEGEMGLLIKKCVNEVLDLRDREVIRSILKGMKEKTHPKRPDLSGKAGECVDTKL